MRQSLPAFDQTLDVLISNGPKCAESLHTLILFFTDAQSKMHERKRLLTLQNKKYTNK